MQHSRDNLRHTRTLKWLPHIYLWIFPLVQAPGKRSDDIHELKKLNQTIELHQILITLSLL